MFITNSKRYIVSSNYFYLIIVLSFLTNDSYMVSSHGNLLRAVFILTLIDEQQ